MFVEPDTLVWMVGLFSAALGCGARNLISESGVIGQETELTLIAKAKFDMASEIRPRLLTLVQERLHEMDVVLVS